MQRTQADGVIISCDFCSVDWDPNTGQPPMIEGHHGSCICLSCVQQALTALGAQPGEFNCPLCLRTMLPATLPRWSHASHPNVHACKDCVHQAAKAFSRDPDIDWTWKK